VWGRYTGFNTPEDMVLLEPGSAVRMGSELDGENEVEGPLPTAEHGPGGVGGLAPQWHLDVNQELQVHCPHCIVSPQLWTDMSHSQTGPITLGW